MTIFQPHKKQSPFFTVSLVFMLALLIIFGALNMFIYNETVDLQYAIQAEGNTLQELRSTNTALKSTLYQTLDARNLKALVEQKGFIKITAPQYVSSL